MKTNFVKLATMATAAALMIVPTMSFADGYRARADRNNWNNIAIGAGAVGVLGLLSHNSTLATAGLLGAGYSLYRSDTVSNCGPEFYRGDVHFAPQRRPDFRGDHGRRR